MKKLILALACLLSPLAALGADLSATPKKVLDIALSPLSVEPSVNWSGFYMGVQAGAGLHGATGADLSPVKNTDLSPVDRALRRSGALGGVQAGYGFQSGALVYGVEGDLAFATLRGSQDANGVVNGAPGAAMLEAKTNALATLRGRVGYASGPVLLYGTGGFVAARQESALTVNYASTGGAQTGVGFSSGLTLGGTAGGGLEYMFAPRMSLKLEYLYAYMGDLIRGDVKLGGLHLVRAGANYRF